MPADSPTILATSGGIGAGESRGGRAAERYLRAPRHPAIPRGQCLLSARSSKAAARETPQYGGIEYGVEDVGGRSAGRPLARNDPVSIPSAGS